MSGFSTYTVFSSILVRRSVPVILLPLAGVILPVEKGHAQIVSAGDATGTLVNAVDNHVDITGGRLSDDRTNLFQSFEQFDLPSQQTANFVTPDHVQNVVGRINSDQASTIDGTLQVSGSDANLYLMNPAGILLGPDAQLNLSGGFTATTATDLTFENDEAHFYFENEQAGAVVNLGDLSVEAGQAINLVGGSVVNTGQLSAPAGSITLTAVEGESLVRLSQGDQLLSLEVEALDAQGYSSITPTSLSEMLTGHEVAHADTLMTDTNGNVRLTQSNTAISEGFVGNVTVEATHNIIIDAIDDNELRFAGGTNVTFTADSDQDGMGSFLMNSADTLRVDQGNVTIAGADITVGHIDTSTDAENVSSRTAGGDVTLMSSQQVIAESITTKGDRNNNAAAGGNVRISAELGDITVNGDIDTRSQANTSVSARAGDITITANNGNLTTNNILAYSEAFQSNAGSAGNVTIDALAVTTNGGIRANASTYGSNAGRGGNVTITSNVVNVIGGINTISQGDREASNSGNISVTAEEEISVTGDVIAFSAAYGGPNSGNGGNVLLMSNQISTGSIGTQTSASNWSDPDSGGKAGNVTLQAYNNTAGSSIDIDYIYATSDAGNGRARNGGTVTLTADFVSVDGIQTFSQARGNAAGNSGDVSLYADTDLQVGFGGILSSSRSTNGITGNSGKIKLVANDINLRGTNRVSGESVLFLPSDLSQNIQIGTPMPITNTTLLSIGERELNAIGDVEQIQVGEVDSTGIVTLLPHTVSLPTVIEVQGGEQLVGTAGDSIFSLESATAGTLTDSTTLRFSNIEQFSGGPGGSNSVRVQSPISSPFEIDLENLTNIQSVVGNSNETVELKGSNSSNLWQITGSNQGSVDNGNVVNFQNFGTLIGGTSNDQFYLQEGGSLTGRIDGESGNNSLSSPSVGNLWEVTGRNQGQLLQSDDSLLIFDNIGHLENTAAGLENSVAHQVSFLGANAQITDAITAGQNDLILVGDRIAIGAQESDRFSGGLVSGTGRLFIRPQSEGVAIELGGSQTEPQTEDSSSTLSITQREIEAIQAGFLDISVGGEDTDSITLNDTVSFLDSVVLQAQGDITGKRLANSRRAGISSLGAIALTSQSGEIKIGEVQTNSADVTLSSPGSIEISFINTTEGPEVGLEASLSSAQIIVDTQESFVATDADSTGASLISNSNAPTAINITYGNAARPAQPFIIGMPNNNGTLGAIAANGSTIQPFNIFSGPSTTVGRIKITDRGSITPDVTPDVLPVPDTTIISTTVISAQKLATVTSETTSGGFPMVSFNNTTATANELATLFTQIEIGNSNNFNQYLGISNSDARPPATLTDIQSTLRIVEQETVVTPAIVYVYFVPDASSEAAVVASSEHTPQPNDQLEVMVVTQDDEPVRQRRWGITRSEIEAVSQELRQQVTSEFSTAQQYLPPAQQMYDWIVQPIEKTLQERGVNSLGFVMDTGLRTLPIATMHTGDRYLIEDYSLGILPTFSLTDFGNITEAAGREHTDFSTAQVLAMGASTFKNQPDLPAVNAEVKLIAEEIWEGDAFLNEDFVLSNLQTQLQNNDYGVVHLATHAVFESGNLDSSYIQLWDQQLSLSQVSDLHLSEADIGLIILSACSTALGDAASEYGFAGFAVNSGSPSALASIWPVSDEGTLGFMAQFYEQLRTAPARVEALRQTQLSLIGGDVSIQNGIVYGPNDTIISELPELVGSGHWDFSHPFYWSAFTMIGNPW